MTRYLLDSNHLANGIRKVSALRERIREMRRKGHKFATCWPALFELEMGIAQTKDAEACHRNLRILLKEVRIRPLDWGLLGTFGQLHMQLKSRGRVLSFVDKVLAALAIIEDATILTADLDFQSLPEIRTE